MISKKTLDSCREYLRYYHIFVSKKWLTEALEYFINEVGERDIHKVHINVKKQWFLHDLTQISPGCLPHNLEALTGHYMLQINHITSFEIFKDLQQFLTCYADINRQMKRAVNSLDMHYLEDKMLLLYMTDGVKDVRGVVLDSITNLYITTVLGVKVLIKGPVRNYGDLLLLTNDNCQLLGGEVEHLLHENYELVKNLRDKVKEHSIKRDNSRNDNGNSSRNEEIQIINDIVVPDSNDTNIMPNIQTNTSIIIEDSDEDIEESISLKRSVQNLTNVDAVQGSNANGSMVHNNECEGPSAKRHR